MTASALNSPHAESYHLALQARLTAYIVQQQYSRATALRDAIVSGNIVSKQRVNQVMAQIQASAMDNGITAADLSALNQMMYSDEA